MQNTLTFSPQGIEKIYHEDVLLVVIIRASFKSDGIAFFTPGDFSQQLGYMNRPGDYTIAPHVHNTVLRAVELTQEVLFIRSGVVRLDIYTQDCQYLKSLLLHGGDVALLAHGGHGLKMLEESEIVEVKQGPYVGDTDKTRFTPVEEDHVILPTE